ncbi:MAG: ferrochelatase, partial [Magnetococcales bacterium]|nr:ferrochelatase [Magnetococcales bacterium]
RRWWLPLLFGIISRRRPRRLRPLYEKIQIPGQGMPLFYHTRQLTAAVAQSLHHPQLLVRHAMRYGQPSLDQVVAELYEQKVAGILLFPLFPQYSGTTTASCHARFHALLADLPLTPASRTALPYYDHPAYIAALATSVRPYLNASPEAHLLISFHGLPQRYVDQGDPYAIHCEATARLLASQLDLVPHQWRLSYQSRFGKEPWLLPATDELLRILPEQGIKQVVVVTPGFAADCLETLEEIGHTGKESFLAAGGEFYATVPCLNSEAAWVAALTTLIKEELAGWLQAAEPPSSMPMMRDT